jgi:hypothetical protein
MAIFSNKKGIRTAKEAAGGQQYAAMSAMEAVDRERARGIAGEQAKAAVWGLLGSDPNTFTSGSGSAPSMTDVFDTSGTGLSSPAELRQMGPNVSKKSKTALLDTAREGILDPEAYAAAISNTAQFRIQSKRVAESEQLLNQEGPAWDMLSNSVLGVINEGSALQLRDTMRKLKNQYAKGGSARRTAMFEANELMAGERAMRMRVQETWQANLDLYDTVRQNADRVAAGTAMFMAGLPLVNDSYRDAMQRTAALQIDASSMANNAIMAAYDTKMTQQPVNFGENFVEGLVKTVGSLALSYVTKGAVGAGGTASGVSQMLGGNPQQGFTPRGSTATGTSTGAPSEGRTNWMDGVLKSGLDYLNTIGDDNEYKAEANRTGVPQIDRG